MRQLCSACQIEAGQLTQPPHLSQICTAKPFLCMILIASSLHQQAPISAPRSSPSSAVAAGMWIMPRTIQARLWVQLRSLKRLHTMLGMPKQQLMNCRSARQPSHTMRAESSQQLDLFLRSTPKAVRHIANRFASGAFGRFCIC